MKNPALRSAVAVAAAGLLLLAGCGTTQHQADAPVVKEPVAEASGTPVAAPSAAAQADWQVLATAPVPARCGGPAGTAVGFVRHDGSEGSPFEGVVLHGETLVGDKRATPTPVAVDLDGDRTPELVSGYWCDNLDGPFGDAILVHDVTGKKLLGSIDPNALGMKAAQVRTLTADRASARVELQVGGTTSPHVGTMVDGKVVFDVNP